MVDEETRYEVCTRCGHARGSHWPLHGRNQVGLVLVCPTAVYLPHFTSREQVQAGPPVGDEELLRSKNYVSRP